MREATDVAVIEAFLHTFPNGTSAEAARNRASEPAWGKLQDTTSPTQIVNYLKKYESTPSSEVAKQRLSALRAEEKAWETVRSSLDVEQIRSFRQSEPQGRFNLVADLLIEKLQAEQAEWSRISLTDDARDYEAFLRVFPDLRLKQQATDALRRLRDDEAGTWAAARESRDPDQLKALLLKYPNGRSAADAQRMLDRITQSSADWARMEHTASLAQLEEYQRTWLATPAVEAGISARIAFMTALSRKREQEERARRQKLEAERNLLKDATLRQDPIELKAAIAEMGVQSAVRSEAEALLDQWSAESADWTKIANNSDDLSFRQFLARWPAGRFAAQARSKIEELSRAKVAPEPPPSRPTVATPQQTSGSSGLGEMLGGVVGLGVVGFRALLPCSLGLGLAALFRVGNHRQYVRSMARIRHSARAGRRVILRLRLAAQRARHQPNPGLAFMSLLAVQRGLHRFDRKTLWTVEPLEYCALSDRHTVQLGDSCRCA